MGYESKLIVGEVHGNRRGGMVDDPCPMWMNTIVELSLSKMGQGGFAELRSKSKYSGVFIYRTARLAKPQINGLEMAVSFILDNAPDGSFAQEVDWWKNLRDMASDERIEHKEWEDSYGEPFRRLPIAETAAICRRSFDAEEAEGRNGYRRELLAADVLDHFVEGIKAGRWQEYDPTKDGTDPMGKIMLIHEGY